MANPLGIGIIGCGNISAAYLKLTPLFRALEVRACADIDPAAAELRGKEFGVEAQSVEVLLASSAVDVVINLTVPAAHYGVSKSALEAGKHVYSEKPFVLSVDDGMSLQRIAKARNLRVGSAPDTFLGGAPQYARKLIDEGAIGTVTAGTVFAMNHGMEHWHPNPDFFFLPGAGPVLDVGPYYIANLINLIGPVKRVASMTNSATPDRTIWTEGPRRGARQSLSGRRRTCMLCSNSHRARTLCSARVGTSGPAITATSSSTAPKARCSCPIRTGSGAWSGSRGPKAGSRRSRNGIIPFGVPNDRRPSGNHANYRTAGLADMAMAIVEGRESRCSLERALHGIEVSTAILKSGEIGAFVDMQTTCARPEPLGPDAARALLV